MAETLLFSVTISMADGIVAVYAKREDGQERSWWFPEAKLRVFRALNGDIKEAVAFLLGEQ